jgi:hypothetical protein
MLERCSGIINSQELPEQRSGVQKMSSSVEIPSSFCVKIKRSNSMVLDSNTKRYLGGAHDYTV